MQAEMQGENQTGEIMAISTRLLRLNHFREC